MYIAEADKLKDKELLKSAIHLSVKNFHNVNMSYFACLPPHLFSQVVSSPHISCPSEILSERIADYIREKKNGMTQESFYFLTHFQILPRISVKEAMWYLKYALTSYASILIDETLGGYEGSLKHHCIDAVCQDLKHNLVDPLYDRTESRGDINSNSRCSSQTRLISQLENRNTTNEYSSLPMEMRLELLEQALLTVFKFRNKKRE